MTVSFLRAWASPQRSRQSSGMCGNGIMLDTNPQLKCWRGAVSQACPMEAPLNCASGAGAGVQVQQAKIALRTKE